MIEPLLTSTILVRIPTGLNVDGEESFTSASGTSVRCCLEHGTTVVRDARGEEVVSSLRVYLSASTTTHERMQISTDSGTTWLRVIRLDPHRDFNGRIAHYVAAL